MCSRGDRRHQVRRRAAPAVTVVSMDGGEGEAALLKLRPERDPFRAPAKGAKLTLCRGLVGGEPISDPEACAAALAAFASGGE